MTWELKHNDFQPWLITVRHLNSIIGGIFCIGRNLKFTCVGRCLKARAAGFLDRLAKIRQHFGVRRKGQLRLVRPQDERDQSETKENVGSCNCRHAQTTDSHRPRHNSCPSQGYYCVIIPSSKKRFNPRGKKLRSKQIATSQGISRTDTGFGHAPTTYHLYIMYI